MQPAKKLLLSFFIFLLMIPVTQAATTLCLEWEVPAGTALPDFDITLVLGRKRVLYPPNHSTLKLGNSIAAIHEKTSPTDQECITLVTPDALANYTVGIHHYSKDASALSFLELYELKKDGTAQIIDDYKAHFENNFEGNATATPRSRSHYWVLIPVTEIMATLAPASVAEAEPEPQPTSAAEEESEPEAVVAKSEKEAEPAAEAKPAEPDCEPGEGKDLRHCDFAGKNLDRANFQRSDVSGVSFKNARLIKAKFNDAKCYKADFSHTNMRDASFVRAKCAQSDFTKSNLRKVNFRDADLTKANFNRADIRKANFNRARLRRANYKEASRDEGANFENIQK